MIRYSFTKGFDILEHPLDSCMREKDNLFNQRIPFNIRTKLRKEGITP